jgi:hypothetical protein
MLVPCLFSPGPQHIAAAFFSEEGKVPDEIKPEQMPALQWRSGFRRFGG